MNRILNSRHSEGNHLPLRKLHCAHPPTRLSTPWRFTCVFPKKRTFNHAPMLTFFRPKMQPRWRRSLQYFAYDIIAEYIFTSTNVCVCVLAVESTNPRRISSPCGAIFDSPSTHHWIRCRKCILFASHFWEDATSSHDWDPRHSIDTDCTSVATDDMSFTRLFHITWYATHGINMCRWTKHLHQGLLLYARLYPSRQKRSPFSRHPRLKSLMMMFGTGSRRCLGTFDLKSWLLCARSCHWHTIQIFTTRVHFTCWRHPQSTTTFETYGVILKFIIRCVILVTLVVVLVVVVVVVLVESWFRLYILVVDEGTDASNASICV